MKYFLTGSMDECFRCHGKDVWTEIYCWLWVLIFQIHRWYSVVFVPQLYFTLIPQPWGSGATSPRYGGVGEDPSRNWGLGVTLLIKKNWDVCWPTILGTHGIGLTIVFSHCIFPIKEKHCNTSRYGMIFYCNNICDCVRKTVRV